MSPSFRFDDIFNGYELILGCCSRNLNFYHTLKFKNDACKIEEIYEKL
jgi:hypothetical protein